MMRAGDRRSKTPELSQSIVIFLSKLHPIYVEEYQGAEVHARSLRDGSLVAPMDEDPENQNGFIRVTWPSADGRGCIIRGLFLAQLALVDYVRFHNLAHPDRGAIHLQQLAEHFELKTGERLGLQAPDEMFNALGIIAKLMGKMGPAAAVEAIKRLMGG